MKVVILEEKMGKQAMEKFGNDLYDRLIQISDVVFRDNFDSDFTNVPELFDDDEKILLYNPYSMGGKFEPLTNNLATFKNVRYLLSPYSFYSGLDLKLLKDLGIKYRNNSGANAKSVAQHALSLSLNILGKLPILATENKTPDGSILGEEIFGKTAGIVGMGNVGLELARILRSMCLKVVYYNRSKKDIDLEMVSFEKIFDQDLVFLTVATNIETQELFKKLPVFLKRENYLVDISATDDLYDKKFILKKIENSELAGYALELDDPEFMKPTKKCNYLATPHIAWATIDAERRTVRNYLQRAIDIVEGNENNVDFLV